MGKGSKRRQSQVGDKDLEARWEKVFRKRGLGAPLGPAATEAVAVPDTSMPQVDKPVHLVPLK